MTAYYTPQGGLPPQTQLMTQRAVFTSAYAVIPKGCFSDIVTSFLPGWRQTRLWLIARPMSGFSETFSQYVMEVAPGGGSDAPDPETGAEHWLFFTDGLATLTIDGEGHEMESGSYAYIPAGQRWTLLAEGKGPARFHWLRKLYEPAPGVDRPDPIIINERDVPLSLMPDTNGAWGTTRFVDPNDLRHDAHVNIVTFQPGGSIPFEETHVMEHGLYVLQGKAVYKLNQDWVEVEAGDFMWLRAYCPQACYAAGPGPFRYLLYKDVNRHAKLRGPGAFGGMR
ncbi:bifunctional allantoicase/(S)-ureidoglycine aminohydrolase [Pseudorhodobacter sp. MZDSW-24AT]|uniref:bifunctional allantoicase/(S)-ureidoglycine aminohydrolase n=1 Tax=Pseudorhodobacter sp. MZDSW-24AT TaxID=2052957 RepID=UPI000C1F494C|nr:bifunctional allantoicase/(S)-ureidoglycine aminohydrolase [Pseudorhodobacter sp. MZDSW-24AT]PJF09497.1 (S)-ureidoglycine aminohydrolase [Pseudorhodobacter sp. MZDSW-24AT]